MLNQYWEAWMSPSGAQPCRQTKLGSSIPRHMAQLLESRVQRQGTHVHTCSKRVAPLYHIICTCRLLLVFKLKINHTMSCNDCALILVLGVNMNSNGECSS
jgi:hypothetical protein